MQRDALERAGIGLVFEEKASAAAKKRPQLEAAIDALEAGDTLASYSLSRLARSVVDAWAIVKRVQAKGAFVRTLDGTAIDTSTPNGKFMFTMLAACAELERDVLRERTREGLQAARKRGAKLGRPAVLEGRMPALRALLDAGMSPTQAAAELKVSRASVYASLKAGA